MHTQKQRKKKRKKGAFVLVKFENRSRSRKNHNVSISSDSVYDSVAHDAVRTRLSESEAEAKEPKYHKDGIERCDSFILLLLFPTPTIYFSLDCKRLSHKQNRCSASEFRCFSLHRIVLGFWLWPPTLSLVKTSLSFSNKTNIFLLLIYLSVVIKNCLIN